ncbi:MAG: hypothetical protein NWE89_00030 [Candidatus Bathyarchaeota archaeon]|nr:hypothetical protein [Candidatus Bathyarchaeota archaeon]
MKKVFLVSGIDMEDADTESIYLKEAINKRGIESSIVNWDDPDVNWSEANLSISRTTSSYIFNPEKFFDWAKKVEETSTLWNPSHIMEWNHHKRYVIELQEKGIPVPETILMPQNTDTPFNEIINEIPWNDFVLKPCIGGGSSGLRRFNKESPDLETHFWNLNRDGYHQVFSFGEFDFIPCDTLVQPYLPEITEVGEASLIYFGGEFSHSVIKKVKSGDFRAHPIWGAEVLRYIASEEEVEIGYSALRVVGHPTEYARLDMIPTRDGPIVIEIELIDPFMFFDHLPETVESYVDHIENFLNNP